MIENPSTETPTDGEEAPQTTTHEVSHIVHAQQCGPMLYVVDLSEKRNLQVAVEAG